MNRVSLQRIESAIPRDRRIWNGVRRVFADAVVIMTPLFALNQHFGIPLQSSARRVLIETYPHMTAQEHAILFSVLEKRIDVLAPPLKVKHSCGNGHGTTHIASSVIHNLTRRCK